MLNIRINHYLQGGPGPAQGGPSVSAPFLSVVFTHVAKRLPWATLIQALSIMVLSGHTIRLMKQCWRDCVFKQSHHDGDLEETLTLSTMISMESADATQLDIDKLTTGFSGFRITSGKHSGRTFEEVYDLDQKYVK